MGGGWLRVRSESANSCVEVRDRLVEPCESNSCVEVRDTPGQFVEVRSSLFPAGPVLTLMREEWDALVRGIGELDERLQATRV